MSEPVPADLHDWGPAHPLPQEWYAPTLADTADTMDNCADSRVIHTGLMHHDKSSGSPSGKAPCRPQPQAVVPAMQDWDPPEYWIYQNTVVDLQSIGPVIQQAMEVVGAQRRGTQTS